VLDNEIMAQVDSFKFLDSFDDYIKDIKIPIGMSNEKVVKFQNT